MFIRWRQHRDNCRPHAHQRGWDETHRHLRGDRRGARNATVRQHGGGKHDWGRRLFNPPSPSSRPPSCPEEVRREVARRARHRTTNYAPPRSRSRHATSAGGCLAGGTVSDYAFLHNNKNATDSSRWFEPYDIPDHPSGCFSATSIMIRQGRRCSRTAYKTRYGGAERPQAHRQPRATSRRWPSVGLNRRPRFADAAAATQRVDPASITTTEIHC